MLGQENPFKAKKKRRTSCPIFHTAWLNKRALTLKSNTTKYYFGKKSGFLQTFQMFILYTRKILVKFKNILLSMLSMFLKKEILMYAKPAMTCF
jgi:hypothetical protein